MENVTFKELTPGQQLFANQVLQTCFQGDNPFIAWEPKLEEPGQLHIVYKSSFRGIEADYILDGEQIKSTILNWQMRKLLKKSLHNKLNVEAASRFLSACLFGI